MSCSAITKGKHHIILMLADHWELLHSFAFAKKTLCTQREEKPELQLHQAGDLKCLILLPFQLPT